MRHETLSAWLEWLEQQHPKSIDLGLDRVAIVAARLGVTSFNAFVITVAGTNGKGSFVASAAALLRAHGRKVATYTSPHLLNFNERINLDGYDVGDAELLDAFDKVDVAKADVSLTYFEFTTLAAFYIFSQHAFDDIILEIGLGGRLDAVNIIEPDLAVITSIGIDHQEYLGNSLESIAKEKCGILRKSTPLICAEINPPDNLLAEIQKRPTLWIGRDFNVTLHKETWSLKGSAVFDGYDNIHNSGLSIPSQAAAIAFIHQYLGDKAKPELIKATLSHTSLAGRFQRFLHNEVTIILDVAHNEQAARMLQSRLHALPLAAGCKRIAVFTMLNDKDVSAIVTLLKDDFFAWFLGELNHGRASKISDIGTMITANGNDKVSYSKNIRQAYARAMSICQPGDQIIVFGSFFVVAELLPKLTRDLLDTLSGKKYE